MPRSQRSLSLTETYRARMVAIREWVQAQVGDEWRKLTLADFDAYDQTFRPRAVAAVTQAQTIGARLSTAYLSAYIASETGRRQRTPIVTRGTVGFSRDGRPLAEAFDSPRIGTLAAIKDGHPDPLAIGLERAIRMAGVDTDNAFRASLNEAMVASPDVKGWQRAVRGTCGACIGDIAVEVTVNLPSIPLGIHPNCQCVTQPVVVGVRDLIPLATGVARFAAMSKGEQDAALGTEAAERVRSGDAQLTDFVTRSKLATDQPDFITQTPAKDV